MEISGVRQLDGVDASLAAVFVPDLSRDLALTVGRNRQEVLAAVYRHGALLFRGFSARGAEAFAAVTNSLSEKSFSYVGGASPRTRVSGEVFTSTEYSPDANLLLHNEASYFRTMPDFIWFHCVIAPEVAGETPLGDMRNVLRALDPALVARFAEKGVMYVTNLHGGKGFGKSWQQAYQSDDREVVEERLAAMGQEFAWTDDGQLRVTMVAPGVRHHSVSGQAFWGNQAASFHPAGLAPAAGQALRRIYKNPMQMPKAAFFGDGTTIPDEDVASIVRALNAAETTFSWKVGDVLLVDNQAIAHGRRSFKGDRQILVSLS